MCSKGISPLHNRVTVKKRSWALIQLEVKAVSLCHQYRASPACTYPCSANRFCTAGWPTSSCHLDIPTNDNGQFQNWRFIIQYKKFSSILRVKNLLLIYCLAEDFWYVFYLGSFCQVCSNNCYRIILVLPLSWLNLT